MTGPRHAKVIAIGLALCVVTGFWIALEYANRDSGPGAPPLPPSASPNPGQPGSPVSSPTARPGAVDSGTSPVDVVFKCERNGRISFADKPCDPSSRTLSVTATAKEAPRAERPVAVAPAPNKERSAATASPMKVRALPADTTRDSGESKEFECRQVDIQIANVDAQLRLPHSGPQGDYLNEQRRKLNDRRFAIGC